MIQRHAIRSALRRFARREGGTLTAFGVVMFVVLMVAGGIAVDVMRFEVRRTALQNTADTAVLAAASLTQAGDPRAVAQAHFAAAGLAGSLRDVQVAEGINFRRVRVAAGDRMDTHFLRLVGLDHLDIPATSAAEERIPNVEVSLVLDISGSMRFTDKSSVPQIAHLRVAGRNFAERMMAGSRDELVSISVVPYAGSVNPGARVFGLLGGRTDQDHAHTHAYCMELEGVDFGHSGLPHRGLHGAQVYGQLPHFMYWPIDRDFMQWGWCPAEGEAGAFGATIQYFRGDPEEVAAFIENVPLHDGTGTHYGMRWGLALLDPDSRWLSGTLAAEGRIPARFADRPAPWDDPETLKVIVLMTDGAITDQIRPTLPANPYLLDGAPVNHVRELQRQNSDRNRFCGGENCRSIRTGTGVNRSRFFAACDIAKAQGIIVYTVAFNTTSTAAAQEMRDCASSPAHYFNVLNEGLDDAFQAIAGSIQMLRLTE